MTQTMISASLETIRCHFDYQHAIDPTKVAGILARMEAAGKYDLAPVLVIEDEGNGFAVLDGHHRAEAAYRYGIREIPAWVISVADYCRLIETEFGGQLPGRISDLDDYIICGDHTYFELGIR